MFITPANAQQIGTSDSVNVTIFAVLAAALIVFLFVAYRRGRELRLREEARRVPGARASAMATPLKPAPPDRNAVFLSYRRTDSMDITGRLYDRLVSELGRDAVFKDIDSIPLGSDFREHIGDNLQNCMAFLLVIGKNWDGDRRIDDPRDLIRIEVETALKRKIPVIPILVHDAEIPNEDVLPPGMRGIAYRQAIRVRPDPDFHRDVERIVAFLKSRLSIGLR